MPINYQQSQNPEDTRMQWAQTQNDEQARRLAALQGFDPWAGYSGSLENFNDNPNLFYHLGNVVNQLSAELQSLQASGASPDQIYPVQQRLYEALRLQQIVDAPSNRFEQAWQGVKDHSGELLAVLDPTTYALAGAHNAGRSAIMGENLQGIKEAFQTGGEAGVIGQLVAAGVIGGAELIAPGALEEMLVSAGLSPSQAASVEAAASEAGYVTSELGATNMLGEGAIANSLTTGAGGNAFTTPSAVQSGLMTAGGYGAVDAGIDALDAGSDVLSLDGSPGLNIGSPNIGDPNVSNLPSWLSNPPEWLQQLGGAGLGGLLAKLLEDDALSADDQLRVARGVRDMNLVDQSNQYGSSTWAVDPVTGRASLSNTLNPAMQRQFDSLTGGIQSGIDSYKAFDPTSYGPLQTSFNYDSNIVRSLGNKDFSQDRDDVEEALLQRSLRTLDPQFKDYERALYDRLSNQGATAGSEYYQREVDNFMRGRNDAYDQARNSSILGGGQEQSRLFGMDYTRAKFANDAQAQAYNQAYNAANFANDAQRTLFDQGLRGHQQGLSDLTNLFNLRTGINAPGTQGAQPIATPDVLGLNQYNQQNKNNNLFNWMNVGANLFTKGK